MKYLADKIWKPILKWYLSKTRIYRYNGLKLWVPSQVFHPAFFFSTRFLLNYLLQLDLKGKTILELGAGSGLISFVSSQKGALVTATDINNIAVEYLIKNKKYNKLDIKVIQSDLFKDIPAQDFDLIVINPPYFKKEPVSNADYAWYCGENGEYFDRLFADIKMFLHTRSTVIMVLSEYCDIKMIQAKAANAGFELLPSQTKKIFWEINIIYTIVRTKNNANEKMIAGNIVIQNVEGDIAHE